MPRFFIDKDAVCGGEIEINGEDALHISRSLRMAPGDVITACDTDGTEYEAELVRFTSDSVFARIISKKASENEPPVDIALFQAYPKGDKIDLIVQKAVELGALRIVPFESERCVKRPNADKAEKQTARLGRIALEAAKQCGRGKIPEVLPPIPYARALSEAGKYDAVLFCYEGEGTTSLKQVLSELSEVKSIAVFVGSEGGFSAKEALLASGCGFRMCSLGRRILRCETAPIFALSCICCHFEL